LIKKKNSSASNETIIAYRKIRLAVPIPKVNHVLQMQIFSGEYKCMYMCGVCVLSGEMLNIVVIFSL
jgi:hypothetical protein